MTINNEHVPTAKLRERVSDLAACGIPKHLIAMVVKLNEDTLSKHYEYELKCAKSEWVERIGKVVALQAANGCPKAQALYLKTQGAQYGWVEKQIVENVDSKESEELKAKIADLENKYQRDY